jgi:hypothetical protein
MVIFVCLRVVAVVLVVVAIVTVVTVVVAVVDVHQVVRENEVAEIHRKFFAPENVFCLLKHTFNLFLIL